LKLKSQPLFNRKTISLKNFDLFQQELFERFKDKSALNYAQEAGYHYMENAADRAIFPLRNDLEKLNLFEESLPRQVGNDCEIIKQLINSGSPNTVNQLGGRYFGFVNGSVIPVGLAAKVLASFWDQNAAMRVISPISSKLEEVVESWIVDYLKLPSKTVAGFVSGTSMANFCGLAAARYRVLKNNGYDIVENGLNGAPRIRLILSDQAHSSVLKAVSLLGFGNRDIEWVKTDSQGRMLVEHLPSLDSLSIIVLGAGNVNSGAFDPFNEICDLAEKSNSWVHVDGAFGLWAGGSLEFDNLCLGMNKANSWSVDGHKTLNTPYDSGIVLCLDEDAMVHALHMTGSYLVLSQERDGMFYTPEMSRRARVIELWAVLKYLGREGIDKLLSLLHSRAKLFATHLKELDGFEVLNEVVFNQVLIACNTDQLTEEVIKLVQEERVCWLGGSQWHGRKVIRISVCSWATTEEDVRLTIASLDKALRTASKLS